MTKMLALQRGRRGKGSEVTERRAEEKRKQHAKNRLEAKPHREVKTSSLDMKAARGWLAAFAPIIAIANGLNKCALPRHERLHS